MDETAERALLELALPNVDVIPLRALESNDPRLASVRPSRSHAEYCWTAASCLIAYSLAREPELDLITYLDADMEFYADPTPLFEELDAGSVMLSPHRCSPEFTVKPSSDGTYDEPGGLFNVQFTSFRRDHAGMAALGWWREQCLEWCRNRYEPGRYAGQKYLDYVAARFRGVHVMEHLGAGVAPWNVSQYTLEPHGGEMLVDGAPLIFHHFQSLEIHLASTPARALSRRTRAYRFTDGPIPLVWTTGWRLTERELELLWDPHVERLAEACSDVAVALGSPVPPLAPVRPRHALFQVTRRRIPPRIRTAYWDARLASAQRREHSVQGSLTPGSHAPLAARS